ncbi:hypothetical protein B0H16DRAFT_1723714 [Mycena metata]|uniref:Uncharacterized protein n=1 Tax=Mycena metata TaxID=1033252 RepID=A0AAD7J189_9AGAR|nr:hypothetical protein B0H16DRAFT_1723714 [Mycena metata]
MADQSESNLRNAFEGEKNLAAIIFIDKIVMSFDELDSIPKARGSGNGDGGGASDRARPDPLGPPASPSSRPAHLHPPPQRLDILRAYFKRSPVSPEVNLDFLVKSTHAYSGICQRAAKLMSIQADIRRTREKIARDEAAGEDVMKVEEDADEWDTR